jgi:NADP-dependent 3-hydroxy acid dehydrogenase YdfG
MARSSADFKTGVILGASSGVGRELLELLAPRTSVLHVAARRAISCDVENVATHQCDVTQFSEVSHLFEALGDGQVDFIVNCVGVGFYAPMSGDFSEAWAQILHTNVLGLANILTCVDRVAAATKLFLNVSSLAAHIPSATPGNAMYTASKVAARSLVDDFRKVQAERGSDLRVTSLSPGYIKGTDFGRSFFTFAPEAEVDLFEGRAAFAPRDVAEMISSLLTMPAHLCTDDMLIRPVIPKGFD